MDSPSNTRQPSKLPPPNSVPIRVSRSTARYLRSILTKCNRKSHGRKVKADDIIKCALEQLQEIHFEEIKACLLSSHKKFDSMSGLAQGPSLPSLATIAFACG